MYNITKKSVEILKYFHHHVFVTWAYIHILSKHTLAQYEFCIRVYKAVIVTAAAALNCSLANTKPCSYWKTKSVVTPLSLTTFIAARALVGSRTSQWVQKSPAYLISVHADGSYSWRQDQLAASSVRENYPGYFAEQMRYVFICEMYIPSLLQ